MIYRNKRIFSILLTLIALAASVLPAAAAHADSGKIVICIDAGHGGRDGGTDAGTKTEKEYNLELAINLKDALLKDGRFYVVMTRATDDYYSYLERAQTARTANADLLISMHCNQVDESYVNGTSAYVSVVEKFNAGDLAGKILDKISAAVPIARGKVETRADSGDSLGVYYWDDSIQWDMPGASERGTVSDYYSINTWSSKFGIKSIILEHGYLSNESDLAVLNSPEMLNKIAQAEADAIIEYYTNHEHEFSQTIDYPSNCVFSGTLSSRCTICGIKTGTAQLTENPDAHFWRKDSYVAPTCTDRGEEHYICQISYNLNAKGADCDVHEKTVTIPALGHNYKTVFYNDGHSVRICQRCGDELYTLCLNGTEHSYELTSTSDPTCTTPGAITYRCTSCGDSYTDDVAAPGHVYQIIDRIAPTATVDGYDVMKCAVCGDEYKKILPACDHIFTFESQEPTCADDGYTTTACPLCGFSETTVLPATGHDFVEMSSNAPTCTETGTVSRKCNLCGTVKTEVIPATSHNYGSNPLNHTCTVCGEKSISHTASLITNHPILFVILILLVSLGIGSSIVVLTNRKLQKTKAERRQKFES